MGDLTGGPAGDEYRVALARNKKCVDHAQECCRSSAISPLVVEYLSVLRSPCLILLGVLLGAQPVTTGNVSDDPCMSCEETHTQTTDRGFNIMGSYVCEGNISFLFSPIKGRSPPRRQNRIFERHTARYPARSTAAQECGDPDCTKRPSGVMCAAREGWYGESHQPEVCSPRLCRQYHRSALPGGISGSSVHDMRRAE